MLLNIVFYSLSHFQLFCSSMECSPQALLSMEFPRQEYWNALPLPSLGDLPDSWIESWSPVLKVDILRLSQ